MKEIHPITPTKDPMPAPPTTPRQPPNMANGCLRKTTARAPMTAPGSLQLSIANCPVLYRSRQLRSLHSMSSRPHILATIPTADIPAPMMLPAPAERRRRGMVIDRRLNADSIVQLIKPSAVPSWKPRLATWVVRIVRAKGCSSAYSAVG